MYNLIDISKPIDFRQAPRLTTTRRHIAPQHRVSAFLNKLDQSRPAGSVHAGQQTQANANQRGPQGPSFDPAASGRLAAKALKDTGVQAAIIGRLAVWNWLPNVSDHAYTKNLDFAVRARK